MISLWGEVVSDEMVSEDEVVRDLFLSEVRWYEVYESSVRVVYESLFIGYWKIKVYCFLYNN